MTSNSDGAGAPEQKQPLHRSEVCRWCGGDMELAVQESSGLLASDETWFATNPGREYRVRVRGNFEALDFYNPRGLGLPNAGHVIVNACWVGDGHFDGDGRPVPAKYIGRRVLPFPLGHAVEPYKHLLIQRDIREVGRIAVLGAVRDLAEEDREAWTAADKKHRRHKYQDDKATLALVNLLGDAVLARLAESLLEDYRAITLADIVSLAAGGAHV